jgi:superfamily II DNA/RNA helicase
VVGIANTGTGKTAAFVLPIIHRLLKSPRQLGQTLVLAPTRELAEQIQSEFNLFSKGLNLLSVLCVGGLGIGPQKRMLMHDNRHSGQTHRLAGTASAKAG